ncbi:hypothetical protein Tco_0625521 [Tanacetum coccineum]|uniref:Uncharacterized protein n=1 Tax=Tanacetum coccineum TaxID=301880 RepID=A0ABQ4WH20_9ASTR
MVTRFDRLDLVELYNLVMKRFETTTPEEDGTEIHMLVERKYPLTKETLERMLSLRLVAGIASEDAYTLLRFIQNQSDEYGSHDGALAIPEQTDTDAEMVTKDWKLKNFKFTKSSYNCVESGPKHNMVAYLEKTGGNAQFHKIVDFLSRSSIFYALTVSPSVSTSLIDQFWNSTVSQTVNNVSQIKASVSGQTILISESSILSLHTVFSLDLSRLATTFNRLERSIQIGINSITCLFNDIDTLNLD